MSTSPGVNLSLLSSKASPRSVGRYDAIYALVYSATSALDAPYFIRSLTEFSEVFGATLSTAAIDLFFQQRHGYGLYVLNVKPSASRVLSVPVLTVGTVCSLTIGTTVFSTTTVANDTQVTVLSRIAMLVNTTFLDIAVLTGTELRTSATTVTGSGVTVAAPSAVPPYPTINDVNASLARIAESAPQGYICAPEFFGAFTDPQRVSLATALEAFTSDPKRLWSYKIDPTLSVVTGLGSINRVIADRALFASVSGCGSYEYPYLVNANGTPVASSLVKVGLMLRRWRSDGFTQPGSGASIPVYGVSGCTVDIEDTAQDALHPLGINVFRRIPSQAGIYSWGSRTLSTDPNWTWETTRVIANSFAKALQAVCRGVVFSTTSITGTLVATTKASLLATAAEYFSKGALWGTSLSDAFSLVMDDTNNTATSQDSGDLNIDAYFKPAPLVERVQLSVTRVPLGLSFTDYLAALGNVEKPTQATQATPAASGSTSGTGTGTSAG